MTTVAYELLSAAREAMYGRDFEQAIYLCRQALERQPSFVDAKDLIVECEEWLEEQRLFDLRTALYEEIGDKDGSAAIEIIERFLEGNPSDVEAMCTKAFYRETPEVALEDINHALALDPQDATTIHHRAYVLMALGRDEEAERDVETALRLDPDSPNTYILRAWMKLDAGFISEALRDIRSSMRIDPENPYAFAALAHTTLLMGQFEKTLKYAQKAEEYFDPDLLLNQAEALIRLGRDNDAATVLETHIREWPEDDEARKMFAWALVNLQRPQEALEHLESCEEVFREDGPWQLLRAETALALKDENGGRKRLDEGLRILQVECKEGKPYAKYNLAWCYAQRAHLSEKYRLGIDVAHERDHAMKLLREVAAKDATCVRYAMSEPAFKTLARQLDELAPLAGLAEDFPE